MRLPKRLFFPNRQASRTLFGTCAPATTKCAAGRHAGPASSAKKDTRKLCAKAMSSPMEPSIASRSVREKIGRVVPRHPHDDRFSSTLPARQVRLTRSFDLPLRPYPTVRTTSKTGFTGSRHSYLRPPKRPVSRWTDAIRPRFEWWISCCQERANWPDVDGDKQ
jgi:hypothetical protein